MNKVNIAIIGFGKMGQIRFDSLAKNDNAEIKYIYELNQKINVPLQKKVSDLNIIFNDKDIDAVFICTPNIHNFPLTIKSILNEKFVFCEKPPAFSVKEMNQIINEEKKSSKFIMYGFNHRQHESILLMKEKIQSGIYGKILWIRGRYGKSVEKDFFGSWRSNRKQAGGGILIDQGIHMLDLFLCFVEEFDQVKSFISKSYWGLDIEDNVFAIFKNTKNNVTASLHSTMTQWRHLFSLEIFLEKGYLVLNGLKTSSNSYGKEKLSIAINRSIAPEAKWDDEDNFIFEEEDFWKKETDEFINSIIQKRTPNFGTSKQALNVLSLVERIYRENEI